MDETKSIVNSVQEIEAGPDAALTGAVLGILKDVDAQRIAKTDEVVIRKAVLALLPVVAALEERITSLETQLSARVGK